MEHQILFTGHMIDEKDRPHPRFPSDKEKIVKEEMRKYLLDLKGRLPNGMKGIAGGACGGDILFHELCSAMSIPSEIYLAMPVPEFKQASVSFAGKDWENRFDALCNLLPVHILPEEKNKAGNKNIWERANMWMLHTALVKGGEHTTLIALWDGKSSDGDGGTKHMIDIAKEENAAVRIIHIHQI
jgi:hypothetical protein